MNVCSTNLTMQSKNVTSTTSCSSQQETNFVLIIVVVVVGVILLIIILIIVFVFIKSGKNKLTKVDVIKNIMDINKVPVMHRKSSSKEFPVRKAKVSKTENSIRLPDMKFSRINKHHLSCSPNVPKTEKEKNQNTSTSHLMLEFTNSLVKSVGDNDNSQGNLIKNLSHNTLCSSKKEKKKVNVRAKMSDSSIIKKYRISPINIVNKGE